MKATDRFTILEPFAPLVESLGLSAKKIFTDPRINAWRKLPDRQNCTLDALGDDGRPVRLHIKRYPRSSAPLAAAEVRGLELLGKNTIRCPRLVAHGRLSDGRAFVITEDLTGFQPADRLIDSGFPFAKLIEPTADLAARLHAAGLHHRDLYLCHFFCRAEKGAVQMALIDAARVRPLPALTKRRWIIKDLAQFWYSMSQLASITDEQRFDWVGRYAQGPGAGGMKKLLGAIRAKAGRIASHDARLNRRQPKRNISIPN